MSLEDAMDMGRSRPQLLNDEGRGDVDGSEPKAGNCRIAGWMHGVPRPYFMRLNPDLRGAIP